MKKLIAFLSMWAAAAVMAADLPVPALIPAPVSLARQAGEFRIDAGTGIAVQSAELDAIAQDLALRLRRVTGFKIPVLKASSNRAALNRIVIGLRADAGLPADGYLLTVSRQSVALGAATPAGAFHGVQTLLQLLPKEVEGDAVARQVKWAMPAVVIRDHPRFGWRGLMLDVSRHFFSVAEVKDFIDQMAKYKFNL